MSQSSAAGRRFAGQTVLVTGAASGIGRATAVRFAGEGARVAVADIDGRGSAETVAAIEAAGGTARALALDVASERDWAQGVASIEAAWGALHVLVNNAGIAATGSIVDISLADWRRVLAVNLDGVFLGLRAAIPALRRAGGGAIVNVASVSGIKAWSDGHAYAASKAAVIMLTRTAALECREAGDAIRINAVAPGGVKTPIWDKDPALAPIRQTDAWNAPAGALPGRRFAAPEEIAAAISFLASGEASYITGSVLTVDAGYTA